MNERVVNVFAGFASAFLIILFFIYTYIGKPFGITFAFAPMVVLGITYTMLAIHQFMVVRFDNLRPLEYPVPWKWVVALTYASFSLLVWWVLADLLWSMPIEPELRRLIWLQSALTHVWFLRRFVVWNRPKETKNARDVRQEATDVRQDERDVTQDDTEQGQRRTAREQRETAREQEGHA